jgi:hypothetical protein
MADNLVLGRGKVFFAPYPKGETTGGTKGYLGATPSFGLAQSNTKLDHFSAEGGLKVKDRSVVLTQDMTITLEVDNIMMANLALWFGGTDTGDMPPDAPGDLGTIAVIGRADTIFGALFFEADNAEGENVNYWFPYTNMTPNGTFALKGDTWQVMSFTIEALKRDSATERVYLYTPDPGTSAADDDTPLLTMEDVAVIADDSAGGGGAPATGGTVAAPATASNFVAFYVNYTLTGGTSGNIQLHNGTSNYGAVFRASGASGSVGPFIIAVDGSYTAKLYAGATTGTALATSGAIVVT